MAHCTHPLLPRVPGCLRPHSCPSPHVLQPHRVFKHREGTICHGGSGALLTTWLRPHNCVDIMAGAERSARDQTTAINRQTPGQGSCQGCSGQTLPGGTNPACPTHREPMGLVGPQEAQPPQPASAPPGDPLALPASVTSKGCCTPTAFTNASCQRWVWRDRAGRAAAGSHTHGKQRWGGLAKLWQCLSTPGMHPPCTMQMAGCFTPMVPHRLLMALGSSSATLEAGEAPSCPQSRDRQRAGKTRPLHPRFPAQSRHSPAWGARGGTAASHGAELEPGQGRQHRHPHPHDSCWPQPQTLLQSRPRPCRQAPVSHRGLPGGIYKLSPTAVAPAKSLGRTEARGPPPHPVAVDRSTAMSGRRRGRGRGSGWLPGSSADSQGLPRLTQQLGVPGPASVAAALPAAQQRLPVPTGARHAGPGSLARAAAAQQVVGAGGGWRFGLAPTKREWELPGRGSGSEAKQSILLPWWGSQGCELRTEASPCLSQSRGNRCPQPTRSHQCWQLWAARAQEPPAVGLAPPWGGSGVPHAHGTPSRVPPSLPASTCSSSIASSAHTTLPTARAG